MWEKSTTLQLFQVGKATKAFLDNLLSRKDRALRDINYFVRSFTLPGAAQYSARHYLRDLCVFAGVVPSLCLGRLGYEAKTMSKGGYDVLQSYGDRESKYPLDLKQAMVKVDTRCSDINFWAITVNDCETNSVVKLFEVS
jgi:hypothetical protein